MAHNDSPSLWIERFAPLIAAGGRVLDLACGGGRHTRLMRELGHEVLAVDGDPVVLKPLEAMSGVITRCVDLETGHWPLSGELFQAVVVSNYLHRPLLPRLIEALDGDGILIYETFAIGNERYGRPRNPDYLLRPGELLEAFCPPLTLVAYEQGFTGIPAPSVRQRLCASVTDSPLPLPLDAGLERA